MCMNGLLVWMNLRYWWSLVVLAGFVAGMFVTGLLLRACSRQVADEEFVEIHKALAVSDTRMYDKLQMLSTRQRVHIVERLTVDPQPEIRVRAYSVVSSSLHTRWPSQMFAIGLRDTNWQVRFHAAKSAADVGQVECVKDICEAYTQETNFQTKIELVKALLKLGGVECLQSVGSSVFEKDQWLGLYARFLAGVTTEPILVAKADLSAAETRAFAAWLVGYLGDSRGKFLLDKFQHDQDENVRRCATSALKGFSIGDR